MNEEAILLIVTATSDIIRRHFDATGEILSDASVHAQLMAELRSGQGQIAAWFEEKGLPLPE